MATFKEEVRPALMGSCGMGTAVSTGHSRRMPAVPQGVLQTWVYILALLLISWVSGVGMRDGLSGAYPL